MFLRYSIKEAQSWKNFSKRTYFDDPQNSFQAIDHLHKYPSGLIWDLTQECLWRAIGAAVVAGGLNQSRKGIVTIQDFLDFCALMENQGISGRYMFSDYIDLYLLKRYLTIMCNNGLGQEEFLSYTISPNGSSYSLEMWDLLVTEAIQRGNILVMVLFCVLLGVVQLLFDIKHCILQWIFGIDKNSPSGLYQYIVYFRWDFQTVRYLICIAFLVHILTWY